MMKKVLTSTLLSATILGAGLVVSGNVSAAGNADGSASTDASVSFIPGDPTKPIDPVDPTNPTDPTDPGDPGDTGNTGNLAIVYATDAISFGTDLTIPTSKATTVNAIDMLSLEVGDIRGTNAGWELDVAASDFVAKNGDVLTGAKVELGKGDVSVVDAAEGVKTAVSTGLTENDKAQAVLTAKDGIGSGITVDNIKKTDISLTIPTGVAKAESYSSTMNWTLKDAPK
ncbi:WxL domain-containing protein [Dellaglioa sp. L3N]